MNQGTVVLAGVLPVEHVALDRLVAEFGWSLEEASSIARVTELNAANPVVPSARSWELVRPRTWVVLSAAINRIALTVCGNKSLNKTLSKRAAKAK